MAKNLNVLKMRDEIIEVQGKEFWKDFVTSLNMNDYNKHLLISGSEIEYGGTTLKDRKAELREILEDMQDCIIVLYEDTVAKKAA